MLVLLGQVGGFAFSVVACSVQAHVRVLAPPNLRLRYFATAKSLVAEPSLTSDQENSTLQVV